ncbi:MAG: sugar phosphate isomerase/epimerase [Clostridia bacterium]|nr:sugar phosphate isomerase/epimerase [Clostridia bacterium]
MKVGNTTGYFWYGKDADEKYGRMAEVGYEAADQSMCDIKDPIFHDDEALRAFCNENKAAALRHSITINQLHGPWPTYDTDDVNRAEGWRCFHRAVLACHMMEIPYMVFHPQMPYGWGHDPEPDPELGTKLTLDLMYDLLPDCEKYGVTICLENMPFRSQKISPMEQIVGVLKTVNHPNAGICFDTGHSLVFKHDIADMARLAAPYLKCLHVHDNDGTRDGHRVPFHSEGTADWNRFTDALAEINYRGVLSLECMGDIPDVPMELRLSYEKVTYATGRYLADQVAAKIAAK